MFIKIGNRILGLNNITTVTIGSIVTTVYFNAGQGHAQQREEFTGDEAKELLSKFIPDEPLLVFKGPLAPPPEFASLDTAGGGTAKAIKRPSIASPKA